MIVITLLAGRSWTSVQNTELDDRITNDASLNGPTFLSLNQDPDPENLREMLWFNLIKGNKIAERTWTSPESPTVVMGILLSNGFRLIGQAGSGVGFSGKARYSAAVAVTDYRWTWTLVHNEYC